MTRRGDMPGVVRVTAGQRRAPAQQVALALPPKKAKAQTGYVFPERGAIEELFRDARKWR